MKRFLALLFCALIAKKKFSISKKKYVIFDSVNSEILSKILPKNETYIISARINKIKVILFNFKTIYFLIKNIFQRSITVNYFISLINQINPKFVITTIDNSVTFSILTKYFENKINFVAIQNATRGELYDSKQDSHRLYFTNYMGIGLFDKKILEKKRIVVKNYFNIGSLRNSYFKNNFSIKKYKKKKYDICFVGKNIINKNIFNNDKATEATLKFLNFLAYYVKKYNKKIVIQSKSAFYNELEFNLYKKLFKNTDCKIEIRNTRKFTSYKNISMSKLVVGAPSTLLREASTYPNTKIFCFETRKKNNGQPFTGINHTNNVSYLNFEKRMNFLLNLRYKSYLNKLDYSDNYVMSKKNTVKFIKNYLK